MEHPPRMPDSLRIAKFEVDPAHRELAGIWAMAPKSTLFVDEKTILLASFSINIWVDLYPLTQNVCCRGEDACQLPSTFLGLGIHP